MKQPNFLQLTFLAKNSPNTKLFKHADSKNLGILFLNHLKENFQLQSKEFKVLEPFIDPIFEENSGSSISLNGVEVGEISLLYNSNFGESSLIYFSPSGLIESLVFNFEDFYEYTVSDYLLIIYELTGIIESQLKLYKNEE